MSASLCLRGCIRCGSSMHRPSVAVAAKSETVLRRSFASSSHHYKLPKSIQHSGGASTPAAHHQHSVHLPAALSQCSPAIVSHAKGSFIYSKPDPKHNQGKQRALLDFTTGIGVTNLGHCHPRVEAAIAAQLTKGVHLQVNCVTSEPLLQLASKFKSILPPHLASDYQVLFSNSGAESVENAIKLARSTLNRQTVIVFQGGFHGRTLATGAMTTAKNCYRSHFQPSMAGVHVVQFPYCHRCPVSQHTDGKFTQHNCCQSPIEQLKLCLKQQTAPGEVAAILVEPVQGEAGYIVPPSDFFPQLRAIADEVGCLLIADEVQSGFGRTGSFFASTQLGLVPDVIITAKGLANGLPLSAIIAPSHIMARAKPGSPGGTFGGNPVACAAACAVIDTIQEDRILDNVKQRGLELHEALSDLQMRYPDNIGDVRGLGLMRAVEMTDSVPSGTAAKLSKACEKRDLLVLTAGAYEALRFIPPLTITKEEMTKACKIFQEACEEVFGS